MISLMIRGGNSTIFYIIFGGSSTTLSMIRSLTTGTSFMTSLVIYIGTSLMISFMTGTSTIYNNWNLHLTFSLYFILLIIWGGEGTETYTIRSTGYGTSLMTSLITGTSTIFVTTFFFCLGRIISIIFKLIKTLYLISFWLLYKCGSIIIHGHGSG